MTLTLMLAALLGLLALRVPVAIALLVPALAYVVLDPSATLGIAVQQTTSGVNNFAILAVPLFILLGNVALRSQLREDLTKTKLEWNASELAFTNYSSANQFLKREYREGWNI